MNDVEHVLNAPLLLLPKHVLNQYVCLVQYPVVPLFLKGKFLGFNYALHHLDRVSVQSGVVLLEKLRDYMKDVLNVLLLGTSCLLNLFLVDFS
jgi:hypothetical protein